MGALEGRKCEVGVGVGRMRHLDEHTDIASEWTFVGARPLVFFDAFEEGHKCWCRSYLVFRAYFVSLVKIHFDEDSFVAGFRG